MLSRTKLILALASVYLATLAAGGCSSGKLSKCEDYTDCPAGQYCGENQYCTYDCLKDEDCIGGSCTVIGKCEASNTDGGIPYDGQLPPDLGPGVDSPPTIDAVPWSDTKPPPDAFTWPDTPPPPDGPPPDLPMIDGLGPQTCAAAIGLPCTTGGGECGPQASCLGTDSGTNRGICACTCTPDNPATSANEDSCPDLSKNVCGTISLSSGTKQALCFRKCKPEIGKSTCGGDLTCHPKSGGFIGKWELAVCIIYGCEKNADCPVITSTTCNTASPQCPTGQTCLPLVSGHTDGYCTAPGNCDLVSGLCDAHTLGKTGAKVGDPCKGDTDCGNNMYCQMEFDRAKYQKKSGSACTTDSECCSNVCQLGTCTQGLCVVDTRNGYCVISGCAFASTLTIRACPAGSTCNTYFAAGLCQKTCDLSQAANCRGHAADLLGDYECRAWNNLTIGGVQVTAFPVCDFGTYMSCDFFGASSTVDCTDMGDYSNAFDPNPTNMGCRGLDNSKKSSNTDPTGFCLDDTPASTNQRNPMP